MSVGTYNGTSSWLWCFLVHISTFNQHNQIDLSTRQTKRQLALSRHTSVARHLAFMRVIESDLRCRRLYRSVCTPADLAAALEMLLQAQRSSRHSNFLHEDTPDLFNYHNGIWNEINARCWSMSIASISYSSDYGCWFAGGCLRSSLPQCTRDEWAWRSKCESSMVKGLDIKDLLERRDISLYTVTVLPNRMIIGRADVYYSRSE